MISYFYGPDTYRARQAVEVLAVKQGATIRWLDKDELAARPLSEWLSQSTGLFGKELPVIKDVSKLPKSQQEQIVERVKKKSSSELVLWDRGTPDKRTVLFKECRAHSQEFPYLSPDAVALDLIATAKAQDVQLEKAAAAELVVRVGLDGWKLRSELAKLMLRNNPVTADHVRSEVPSKLPAEIFAMLESLAKGARSQALASVMRLLQQGNSEFYVLSMLAYQFRTMLQIRRALDQGHGAAAIAEAAGLSPYTVRNNLSASRRFSADQLLDMLTRILATDFTIKQGKADARTALLMLVMSLAPAPQKTPAAV